MLKKFVELMLSGVLVLTKAAHAMLPAMIVCLVGTAYVTALTQVAVGV